MQFSVTFQILGTYVLTINLLPILSKSVDPRVVSTLADLGWGLMGTHIPFRGATFFIIIN